MGFKWQMLTCLGLGLGLVRQSGKSLVIIAMKLKLNCVCKSYKIVASFFLASEVPGFLISEVSAGLSTKNSVWSQFIMNGSNGIIRGKLFFLLFSCGCFTKETTFFNLLESAVMFTFVVLFLFMAWLHITGFNCTTMVWIIFWQTFKDKL